MAAVLLVFLFLVGLGGPPTIAALAGGVRVSFPGDADFAGLAQEFAERTGLAEGTALAAEFAERSSIGQMRSSTGLEGTIFEDALLLSALALGQVSYVIYGTIEIPEGATLAGRSFFGDYGIVVYGNPMVIVLVARGSGELAAFVITSSSALLYPPFSVMGLLFQLINVPPSLSPSSPPSGGLRFRISIDCQELPAQREIDVAVGSGEVLVELSDSFAVKEAGLGALTVSSFGPGLLFLVTATNYLYMGFVIGEGEQKVSIPLDRQFTLLVQTEEEKTACVEAGVVAADGGYHIVGMAYHN